MSKFFDPISQEWCELNIDIGRGTDRRANGEPAEVLEVTLSPSLQSHYGLQSVNPVIPAVATAPAVKADADGWIAHKPGDPCPAGSRFHVKTADGWCSETAGDIYAQGWEGLFRLSEGPDSIVAYKVLPQ